MRFDPLRVFILVAAVACLGLAMCAHSQPPAKQPPANTAQQQPASPDAAPAPKPSAKPMYFEATKAPGGIYK